MDMANTSKPFALYFLYSLTTAGLLALQGPHQLAQKSTSTTFPFKEDRLITLSFISGSEISGASVPTSNCALATAPVMSINTIINIRFIYNIVFFGTVII
jgi:hypothetical protein